MIVDFVEYVCGIEQKKVRQQPLLAHFKLFSNILHFIIK